MEIRAFAEMILYSTEVEEKLRRPGDAWTDDRPGQAERVHEPARTDPLRFGPKKHGARMPHLSSFADPKFRAIAHHIMANHELQALEAMAATLLAYPDAPTDFRRQMVDIMIDEQRHTMMHMRRLRALGLDFGELPVNGHVWLRTRQSRCVLDYLACLPLTFENGNLDHSLEFAQAFQQAGDAKGREVMRAIHVDEIDHVAFGLRWLRSLKPADWSDWEAYCRHLHWPMSPFRGKGKLFAESARRQAGMDEEFIRQLESAQPAERPRR